VRIILTAFTLALILSSCEPPGEAPADAPDIEGEAKTTLDPPQEAPVTPEMRDGEQFFAISVRREGFEPSSIALEVRTPARLEFVRADPQACTEPISIPVLGLETESLGFFESVEIEFVPSETGVFQFICGDDIMRGRLLVR
jgi:plastocyanin domain-containing protein